MNPAASMGLMAIHRAVKRFPSLGRGLVSVAALSMMLALTPCCEANAAPPPPGAAPAGHTHPHGADEGGHAHDHGAPANPDPCPVWLDNLFHALGAANGATNPEFESHPLPPTVVVLLLPPTAPSALSLSWRSVHSPPAAATLPLYLRIKRLLI